MRITTLISACLIALTPSSLLAQTPSAVQVDTPTRLVDSIPGAVGAVAQDGSPSNRRGWSTTEKGAVIGLVAGAVTGGILAWDYLGVECQCADPVVLLGGLSAGLGAAIGAGVGRSFGAEYPHAAMGGPGTMALRGSSRVRRVSFSWRF